MRCFRSFLNAIQSLNDKEDALNEKQTKSEFGSLLLKNKRNEEFNFGELSCFKEQRCFRDIKYQSDLNCSNNDLENRSRESRQESNKNARQTTKKCPRTDCGGGRESVANCYSPVKLNCELEQLNKINRNECNRRTKFNLTKLLWIKNSLVIDPFPDFTSNTVLVVNKQYKKLFKLVNPDFHYLLRFSYWPNYIFAI